MPECLRQSIEIKELEKLKRLIIIAKKFICNILENQFISDIGVQINKFSHSKGALTDV